MNWNVRMFAASLTVTVAFFTATVAQAAELKPKKVTAGGATRTVTWVVQGQGQEATVTASTSAEWLEIVTPPPTSVPLVGGKARVKVTYQVLAKADAGSRSGQVLVNGVPAEIVEQAGAPCKLKPSSNNTTFEFYGGGSSFTYTLPEGCVATVIADEWITLDHNESTNTVGIEVGELTGNGRTGKINMSVTEPGSNKVTDKKVHTVIQKKRSGAGTAKLGLPTTIKSPEEAGKAAASAVFAGQRLMESGDGIRQFAGDVISSVKENSSSPGRLLSTAMAKLQPAALLGAQGASGEKSCTDGGTVIISSTSATFSACRENGVEKTGYVSVSGSGEPSSETGAKGTIKAGKAGETFRMTTYTDNTYSTVSDTLDFLMTLSFASLKVTEAGVSFDVTINGFVDSSFTANEKATRMLLDAKSLKIGFTKTGETVDGTGDGLVRTTVFTDGELVASLELAMSDLHVNFVKDGLFNTTTVNMTGNYAIKSYPAASCIDGTFNVGVDPGQPLIYDGNKDGIYGGRIVVNGIGVSVQNDGNATADFPSYEGLPAGDINGLCTI